MEAADWRACINSVLNRGTMKMVFQPICELATDKIVGYEALARFPEIEGYGYVSPDVWFARATELGFATELEMMAVGFAIEAIPTLSPLYVGVNVGANTIMWPRFAELIMASFPDHVVLELTEHEVIRAYEPVLKVLTDLRGPGGQRGGLQSLARLAVDDVGAGHSGLATILKLTPDILKMDRSLVEGIDADTTKGALAAGMVIFASATNMTIVAEGIETEAEREALLALGITHGQGYLLGRPAPLPEHEEGVG